MANLQTDVTARKMRILDIGLMIQNMFAGNIWISDEKVAEMCTELDTLFREHKAYVESLD